MGEEITFRFLCDQGLVTYPACPFTGDRTGGQGRLMEVFLKVAHDGGGGSQCTAVLCPS